MLDVIVTIKMITASQIPEAIVKAKPDLLDYISTYLGAEIEGQIVGIVAWQQHSECYYFCHDYVLEEFRKLGIYCMLCARRLAHLSHANPSLKLIAHATKSSLHQFLKDGFSLEYTLYKMCKVK